MAKTEVELLEAKVLSLQQEVLKTMKELKSGMSKCYQQIKWVAEAVKESELGCMEDPMNMDGMEEPNIRHVILFREAVLSFTSGVQMFVENLTGKLSFDYGSKNNSGSNDQTSSTRRNRSTTTCGKSTSSSRTPVIASSEIDTNLELCKDYAENDMDTHIYDGDDYCNEDEEDTTDDYHVLGNDEDDGDVPDPDDDIDDSTLNNHSYTPSRLPSNIRLNIKRRNRQKIEDLGYNTMSRFKQDILLIILRKQENAQQFLEKNQKLCNSGDDSTNRKTKEPIETLYHKKLYDFPIDYDKKVGDLIIGGVHVKINDDRRTLECRLCGHRVKSNNRNLKQVTDMDAAMWNHVLGKHLDGFQCHLCSTKLLALIYLQEHLTIHHKQQRKQQQQQAGILDCEICGRPMSSRQRLSLHKWTHKSEEEKQE